MHLPKTTEADSVFRSKELISISDQRRLGEIAAVLLTALGKFFFMDVMDWKLIFIILATTGWVTYVVLRKKKINGILKYWGFRTDNFGKVVRGILPFACIVIFAFLMTGYIRDTINPTWHIIPVLILYPVWGIIQQFLVVALVAGNLRDLKKDRMNDWTIILLTAVLFGLVHYPYYWLMAGTFLLAVLYGYIYLRDRNIYVMGLFHGGLGALFFYTVVDRDPFMEVFGKLLP